MLCTALTFWTLWWHHQKQQITLKEDFYKAPNDDHRLESTVKWAVWTHWVVTALLPVLYWSSERPELGSLQCLWLNTDFLWCLTLTKQGPDLRMKPASTRGHLNKLLRRKQPGVFKDKPFFFYCSSLSFYRLQEKQLKNNLQILSQGWVANYIKSILSLPLIKKFKTTKWKRW